MNEINHDLPESSLPPEGTKTGQKIKHFIVFCLKLCGAFMFFAILSSHPYVLMDRSLNIPPVLAVIISIALLIIYVKVWQREKRTYNFESSPFPRKMWLYLVGVVPGLVVIKSLLLVFWSLFSICLTIPHRLLKC